MTIKDLMLRVAERGVSFSSHPQAPARHRPTRIARIGCSAPCRTESTSFATPGSGTGCGSASKSRCPPTARAPRASTDRRPVTCSPAGVANVPDTVNVLYADADSGRTGFAPVTDVMSVEMMLAQNRRRRASRTASPSRPSPSTRTLRRCRTLGRARLDRGSPCSQHRTRTTC